ncbi:MAG TPA: HD domain-containing protein, partial [Turneriella sp.]|nr:HD domain-containing protein [Turneriella sp.]
ETKVLAETLERLAATTPKELTRFKSIDENRRDILLPGAALLLTLLKQAQINRFVVSPNGLRDGAVAEYIFNNLNKNVYVSSRTEFRETGLNAIIEKYKMDRAHSHRVAALAVQLFDAFQELHLLPTEARDLLVAAAMLHDIGKFIDYSQHHKHTLYILSNIKLHGYDDAEKQIIAHTARYHRKSSPKPAHLEYEALSNQKKAWILKLSAILRLADAFDRASANSIDTVSAQKINSQKWNLSLGGSNILALEEWALENKKEVFEKIFSIKLVIV